MIRVLIDHDIVAIPEPAIDEAVIGRSDAEEETVKPETLPVSSSKMEDMARTEAAGKMSMCPGLIDVVVGIVTAGIMADPFIVGVNVGSFRMASLVRGKCPGRLLSSGRLLSPRRLLSPGRLSSSRCGTMRGNMSAAAPRLPPLSFCAKAGTKNTDNTARSPIACFTIDASNFTLPLINFISMYPA